MTETFAAPAAPQKRKNNKALTGVATVGLVCVLALGGFAATGINAGQVASDAVAGHTGTAQHTAIRLAMLPMTVDFTNGASTTSTFEVTNDGGTEIRPILGATSFTDLEVPDHPAYDDTLVRITDITLGESGEPSQAGMDVEMTLREFRDTAVSGEAATPEDPSPLLSPGETRIYRITFATPFDIDADAWNEARMKQQDPSAPAEFAFTWEALGAQARPTDAGTAFHDLATWDGSQGVWTLPMSELRAALDVTIEGNNLSGPFVAGVDASSFYDEALDPAVGEGVGGVTNRVLLDGAGRILGTVWLDAEGVLVNGDGDNDGLFYNADGTRV